MSVRQLITGKSNGRAGLLIPGEAAHHNEMIAPTVTE
jgi:hypothetical protein